MAPFRSYEHLLRLAALFAIGAVLFLGLRWLLVPSDYGRFGPYRAAALAANRERPIAEIRKTNAHARIGCESCHGPLAAHAADPTHPATRPDPRATCAVCHVPDVAKPRGFKTVNFVEHAEPGPCTTCHQAHAPRL